MNYTLLAWLAYAIVTAIGMVALGNIFWSVIKNNCPLPRLSAPTEHPLFIVGLSFFLGYLLYEELLYLLAAVQLFRPVTVTIAGGLLTATGIGWLIRRKLELQKQAQILIASPLETVVLAAMIIFVYFWNLYPMYDVDSMHDYLPSIVNLLKHGGLYFSKYEWVNYFMGRGENMVYALGLALTPKSSVFAQLVHGISKVMLMLTVYGAARTLGLGTLSLLTPALILSEEHIIASGTNGHVHINIPYALSLFFIYYSIVIFLKYQNYRYFYISLNAVLFAILCKYAALYHLLLYGTLTITIVFLHQDIRRQILQTPSLKLVLFQIPVILIAAYPFLFRWSLTGSPVFPAALGTFHTVFYDDSIQKLLRLFTYGLSGLDAIKNLSAFMVWPGILSSKILVPVALVAAITKLTSRNSQTPFFDYGIIFFVLSSVIILVQQLVMVFEMRYYRFGIGIYALSATSLLSSIVRQLIANCHLPKSFVSPVTWALVLLVGAYCVRYSFDVMRDRATFAEIIRFSKGAEPESEILERHYPEYKTGYRQLLGLRLDDQHLGLLLEMGWPEFIYPVPGQQIAFGKTGAIPSYAYFDEGSFAHELHEKGIRTVFNKKATDSNYPFPGGAAYTVLQRCGRPLLGSTREYLELSANCLISLSATKDIRGGNAKLHGAIIELLSRPAYSPFTPPTYGTTGYFR